MADVLKMANDSRADEVVIFLDCCIPGTAEMLLVSTTQKRCYGMVCRF